MAVKPCIFPMIGIAAVCILSRKGKKAVLGMLCFVVLLHSVGQTECLVKAFTNNSFTSETVEVQDKYEVKGKSTSNYLMLKIGSGESKKIKVQYSIYNKVGKGDYVKLNHKKSIFGIEYMTVQR